MYRLFHIFVVGFLAVFPSMQASAQSELQETRERVNKNTVYVMGGSLTGTNSALVWDMAKLFDDGYDLRVLPIAGRGSMRTTEDILFLSGIDVGTVQADVLDFFTQHNIYPRLPSLLRYITALHSEEFHVVTGPNYTNIQELEGKKVNFGPPTSGTFMTSSVVFDRLGITVDAQSDSYDIGLDRLRKGEIDAIVRVAGAPTRFLADISKDEALKLLPVPIVGGSYETATLSSEDYPGLIPLGNEIETVSVSSVLVAYNHPEDHFRFQRVDKLANTLYERLAELKSGGSFHPKWQEVDFDQDVEGWTRWNISNSD
ncbi:MAG: TAXI family TRAP transporter solute-binding subunit [Geminicoccales bacterium]